MSVLQDIKDLHIHDFGIEIELHPDEEEKNVLESMIQIALKSDKIDLEDAIDVRNVRNIKLANALLKVRKTRKEQDDLKKKQANIDMQTQSNVQSSEAASQSAIKEMQFKYQNEMEFEKGKSMLEMQRMEKKAELDMMLLKQKLEFDYQMKDIEQQGISTRDEAKEKAKDERLDKQSTHQAELIQQRKQDTSPKDFTGSTDTDEIIDQMMG
jgi:phage-related minor tail protein